MAFLFTYVADQRLPPIPQPAHVPVNDNHAGRSVIKDHAYNARFRVKMGVKGERLHANMLNLSKRPERSRNVTIVPSNG